MIQLIYQTKVVAIAPLWDSADQTKDFFMNTSSILTFLSGHNKNASVSCSTAQQAYLNAAGRKKKKKEKKKGGVSRDALYFGKEK